MLATRKVTMSNKNRGSFVVAAILVAASFLACSPDGAEEEEPSAVSSNELSTTDYTVYDCETATSIQNKRWTYRVEGLSNTKSEIVLRHKVGDDAFFPGASLKKLGTNTWSDDASFTLRLALKEDGAKSIRVDHHTVQRTASAENGFCAMRCEGPTVKTCTGKACRCV